MLHQGCGTESDKWLQQLKNNVIRTIFSRCMKAGEKFDHSSPPLYPDEHVFRTDDDFLTELRIRNQRWRTVYEDHLKKLPTNFKGKKCLHLGDGVRYPTPAEFERACKDKEIPLV